MKSILNFFEFIANNLPILIVLLLLANLLAFYLASKRLPSAYRIAIIGYPRAGKTFLITAIFKNLFLGKVSGFDTIPRGNETIERINNYIELMETGRAIGPTTDQDVFAFRADLVRKFFGFQRKWKTELGDFPGEDSEEFGRKSGSTDYFNTNYFKWAISSDSYIFNIDLASYLIAPVPKIFATETKTFFTKAWQHLQDHHIDGKKNLGRMPVSLVFTKSDLLIRYTEFEKQSPRGSDEFINKIIEYGFKRIVWLDLRGDKAVQIDQQLLNEIETAFSEIVDYFKLQTKKFSVEYVSAITTTDEGGFGIKNLSSHILPR